MTFSLTQILLSGIGVPIVSLAFTPAVAQVPIASHPATDSGQTSVPASQSTVRLSLQTATDLLIKNNLPVIAARYNVDILRSQRIAAGLRPSPTMTFSPTQFPIPRLFHLPS